MKRDKFEFKPELIALALACPMDPLTNDAEASTVKEYLKSLLQQVLIKEEEFSGKRPWGNSGWLWKIYESFVQYGIIQGKLDVDEGWIDELPDSQRRRADNLLLAMVDSL